MKKIISLLTFLLLLTGCSFTKPETPHDESKQETEPTVEPEHGKEEDKESEDDKPTYYHVYFYGSGGTLVSGIEEQTVLSKDELIYPVYERNGYTFSGWNMGEFGEKTDYVYAYAVWDPISYSISYEGLEGASYKTPLPTTFNNDEPAIYNETPTKENYEFIGWSINGDQNVSKTLSVANYFSDVNVKAIWSIACFHKHVVDGVCSDCHTKLFEGERMTFSSWEDFCRFNTDFILTFPMQDNLYYHFVKSVNFPSTRDPIIAEKNGKYFAIENELVEVISNLIYLDNLNIEITYDEQEKAYIIDGFTKLYVKNNRPVSIKIGNSELDCEYATFSHIDSVNVERYEDNDGEYAYLPVFHSYWLAYLKVNNRINNNKAYINGVPVIPSVSYHGSATKIDEYILDVDIDPDFIDFDFKNVEKITIGENCHTIISDGYGIVDKNTGLFCYLLPSFSGNEYHLPEGTKYIKDLVFNHDYFNIETIYCPHSLVELPNLSISSLRKIYLNEEIERIGRSFLFSAFDYEFNLYNGEKYIGTQDNPYFLLYGMTVHTDSIHEDCEMIAGAEIVLYDFVYEKPSGSFYIPENIRFFDGCVYAKNIYLNDIALVSLDTFYFDSLSIGDNPNYARKGDFIYSKDCETLYRCENKNITSFNAENSIETIASGAFTGCKLLKNIVLNEGLITIGDYAFADCAFEKIILPSSFKEAGWDYLPSTVLDFEFNSCNYYLINIYKST